MRRRCLVGSSLVASGLKRSRLNAVHGWHRRLSNEECLPNRRKSGRGPDELAARKALWKKFLADPSQWWDHRCSKRNINFPDFVHSTTREGLWIDAWSNPPWVKAKLAALQGAHAGRVSRALFEFVEPNNVKELVRMVSKGSLNLQAWSKVCEGSLEEVVKELDVLRQQGLCVSPDMLRVLLKECVAKKDLVLGRRVHALAARSGHEFNTAVANHIIRMYTAHGSLVEANEVFCNLPAPDAVGWASIISAYCEHGQWGEAVKLYLKMRESSLQPNNYVYVAVLKACASASDLSSGKLVHEDVMASGFESNQFVGNALLNMYTKCGNVDDARTYFDALPAKNVVTWTTMLAGYAQHGRGQEALQLYSRMITEGVLPNKLTYLSLLKACGSIGAIQDGKRIHYQILEKGLGEDVIVGSTLISMYADCGSLDDARRVFEVMATKNVVTWTNMIAGCAQHGLGLEALELYRRMQKDGLVPDSVTFGSILTACASVGALHEGRQIHSQIVERQLDTDVIIGSTLMKMYLECGSLDEAQQVFDKLPTKTVVTWTAMIAGYARQGCGQEALKLYHRMEQDGVVPDNAAFVSVLRACGRIGAIQEGKRIERQIQDRGLSSDLFIGSALMNMYAECGSLNDSRSIFDRLPTRNVVTWTALINCYGQHNKGAMAVESFEEMLMQGVEPDATTFICLLIACSHVGMVGEGLNYFQRMVEDHGITPTVEHYNCLIDLLARSGRLGEAEDLLHSMPLKADSVGWMSLLTACKTYGNVKVGSKCFDRLVELNPQQAAGYVLMSSIYADAGRLGDAENIENLRLRAGARKKPAKALIEVNNKVHEFIVGDEMFLERDDIDSKFRSLSERADIFGKLKSLSVKMKEEGHVPHTYLVLKPISNKEKEDALCGHAEKLAIAFGLLHTTEGTTLLVIKDLKMCNDCHSGSKIISRMEKREIIVRDAHRVHHFRDGSCSCGDYP